MEIIPEQRQFDFEGEAEKPKAEAAGMELHERDECGACGNFFEGPGGCAQCMNNSDKLKWKLQQNKK